MKAVKLSFVGDVFFLQQATDLVAAFVESGDRLVKANTEFLELMRQESPRHAKIQPTTGDRVQHPCFTGNLKRVIENWQYSAGHHPCVLGALRGSCKKDYGVGTVTTIRQKIVLYSAGVCVAIFIHQVAKLQTIVEVSRGRNRLRPDRGEELDSEFHRHTPLFDLDLPLVFYWCAVPATAFYRLSRHTRPD